MTIRLLYLVSHPIQYQAPLLRRIAAEDGISLRVLFGRDSDPPGRPDLGFGIPVKWDVPLREGYESRVVPGLGGSALARAIAAADAVWMHGWEGPRMWRALMLARRRGIPVLMRGENTMAAMPDGLGLRAAIKRRFLASVFARCRAFLAIGRANRNYYLAHGVAPGRVFPMPYAVDNVFFRATADIVAGREEFRRTLDLEPGRPIVLYAGKFLPRKHPSTLIDAFRMLDRSRTRMPYLLFVGDGPERGTIERAASAAPAIKLLGFRNQTELPRIYDLADIFVLAASREPWGLAINEAMNGACAVVASAECGAAADLVDDSCGATVPAGNAAALAGALTDLLADPARLAACQRAAVARIADWNFDADIIGLRQALAAVMGTTRRA